MLNMLKGAALAAAACGGLALGSQAAMAMPMVDLQPAAQGASGQAGAVQEVRWVCGPYGCVWRRPWRPSYVYGGPGYGYGGPAYGYGGPGWGGPRWGWRHHHHHHWRRPWYPGPYAY